MRAPFDAGRILREGFRGLRDELAISSKAGWDMWPGPSGFCERRKYLLVSLDQSLDRLGLDDVDIFYSHRPDPRHAVGGGDGRAGDSGATRQGVVPRHLLLLPRHAAEARAHGGCRGSRVVQ